MNQKKIPNPKNYFIWNLEFFYLKYQRLEFLVLVEFEIFNIGISILHISLNRGTTAYQISIAIRFINATYTWPKFIIRNKIQRERRCFS